MQFWRFIDSDGDLARELAGTLDYRLSTLALLIAIIAAFVMLPSIEQARNSETLRARISWWAAGSIVMALGIWGMHFTAMLAFSLPVPITYDIGVTLVSMLPALTGCGFALAILVRANHGWRIPAAALFLALGIGAMHYAGMEGMRANALIRYDPRTFLLSILVAYVLAVTALYLALKTWKWLPYRAMQSFGGAVAMGMAVTGAHFMAMNATHFYPSATTSAAGSSIPPYGLAYAIVVVCALLVGAFLISQLVDKRLAAIATSLRESEARHRNAIDTMLDCHIIINDKARILSFNRCAEAMFGYAAEEVLNENVNILMAQPLAGEHDQHIRHSNTRHRSSLSGNLREIEAGGRRKNGELFPLELCTTAFETREGLFYSAVIRDISEKRRAEHKNKMLAAAIECTAENIVITDDQGVIRYVNPAYVKQTGRSSEQVVGKRPEEFGGAYNQPLYKEVREAMQREEVWTGSMQTEIQDGSIRMEEVTVSPVPAIKGSRPYFVAVTRDVTDKDLLEQQLSQAQKLESIGQLAAGIAHEINTPTQYIGDNTQFLKEAFDDLGAMIDKLHGLCAAATDSILAGAIELLLEETDADYLRRETPRAIEQSLEGVQRVSKIVRAMKEFSHPAQDKTPVDLNRTIQSTITVATNEWKYVAEVDTDFDPKLPMVCCLPGEFNQVILNIIINAAHAIGDVVGDESIARGTISVRTRKSGDWAEIRIADTGSGMPASVKERIFDPFFTTKEVGKGTGQGLSIAYNVIVEKHGGTIAVESELGKGTCFRIRLPLDDVADDTEAAA